MSHPTVHDGPVVIVGGGVTGLTSALLLQESGCEVTVVERAEVVGGLAKSFEYDGFVFDVGPHRFHTDNPNVATFLDRILKGDATWFPRCSEVYFQGSYYAWPLKPSNLLQLPVSLAAKSGVDLALNSFRTYEIDSFETYVLHQYGPTLYEHFFRGYSEKFLGIHPRDTHPDWAKVGINRAIIDNNLQMQNLSQLLKTTLMQAFHTDETRYLYPNRGMHQAWEIVSRLFKKAGGRIITGVSARMEAEDGQIKRVWADEESLEAGNVIWTGPITVACEQLDVGRPELDYLGLLLFNICAECDVPRDYQWCYYGADDIVFNRLSIPKFFSKATSPPGTTGICVEVTCMEGDNRWQHAERLTDWVIDDLIRVGMLPNRAAVHDVFVERIRDSYPIYHTDYPGQLAKAREALAQFPNLHLAGRTGMFWYNNMDHSIENAMQLCKKLLREAGRVEAEEMQLAAGKLA
jgi:protoporphyrinogen oxidase